MASLRVSFARGPVRSSLPVTTIEVRLARGSDRARRPAELTFSRLHGVEHWRMRADTITVEEVGSGDRAGVRVPPTSSVRNSQARGGLDALPPSDTSNNLPFSGLP